VGNGKTPLISVSDIAACVSKQLLFDYDPSPRIYHLTSLESVSGQDIVQMFNSSGNNNFQFQNVEPSLTHRYLSDLLESYSFPLTLVQDILDILAALQSGKLDKVTDIAERLLERKPHTVQWFIERYGDLFKP
jgi:hypothetical protein